MKVRHPNLREVDEAYRETEETEQFVKENCHHGPCPWWGGPMSYEPVVTCHYGLPLDTSRGYCYPENCTRDSMARDPVKALRMRKIAMAINNYFHGPKADVMPVAQAKEKALFLRLQQDGIQIADTLPEEEWK